MGRFICDCVKCCEHANYAAGDLCESCEENCSQVEEPLFIESRISKLEKDMERVKKELGLK